MSPSEAQQDSALLEGKIECLKLMSSAGNVTEDGDRYCEVTWDGLLCWPQTLANTTAFLPCPPFIVGADLQSEASKLCMADGRWFFHPEHQGEWTDFSKCFPANIVRVADNFPSDQENLTNTVYEDYFPVVKTIAQAGYGFSMVSLIVAFLILAGIKRLRCPRNTLHMHLFVSFILRAAMFFIKDSLFTQGVGLSSNVVDNNGTRWFYTQMKGSNWECKLVTSLWQYFILSNYSWIFMEGLYLHNLIFMALFSDNSSITLYVILGWGLPLLVIVPWVCLRLKYDDHLCWTVNQEPKLFLVIRLATHALVLINFILFINIVRVLLLKLRASVSKETRAYRRWAKSTLVLVPLFGVHYTVFMGMNYVENDTVKIVWLFCDQLFASFQGFFVAVLYCFLNGEVLAELGKKWHRIRCPSVKRQQNIAGINGRPGNNSYSNTSCLSIGVPKFLPRASRSSLSNRRLCSQYTDHSQLSCCSNLADAANAENSAPGAFEMRFTRPQ